MSCERILHNRTLILCGTYSATPINLERVHSERIELFLEVRITTAKAAQPLDNMSK